VPLYISTCNIFNLKNSALFSACTDGTTFRTCQWLCYHYSESLTLIAYVEEAHDIDGNHGEEHGDQALGDQLIILERNYQGDRCTEWHRRLTQGGIKCANRRTGFIDSEGSHR